MIRTVRVDDLRVGMFLVSYGLGTFDQPMVAPNARISSQDEIEALKRARVSDVVIDTDKGPAPGDDVETAAGWAARAEEVIDMASELPVALKAYNDALRLSRSFMESVRRGEKFDHRDAVPVVDEIRGSLRRNTAAAISLAKLRQVYGYHFTHSANTCLFAQVLGLAMGLPTSKLRLLGLAGLCFDLGKARLPEEILVKPGPLTAREYRIAQTHSLESYKLMRSQPDMHPEVLQGIIEHHERMDGTGYPRGIEGHEMSLFGRILSVVDVYDALTSDRGYAKARNPSEAFGLMYRSRGEEYPAEETELFIKAMGVYPPGSFVRLTSGEYAVVCGVCQDKPLQPKVRVVLDKKLRPLRAKVIDLAEAAEDGLEVGAALEPSAYKVDVLRLLS